MAGICGISRSPELGKRPESRPVSVTLPTECNRPTFRTQRGAGVMNDIFTAPNQ